MHLYALLLSIALDKNYIDVTNDSIIAPAVKNYAKHGSADEKLKTRYYWGCIAMNESQRNLYYANQLIQNGHTAPERLSGLCIVSKNI